MCAGFANNRAEGKCFGAEFVDLSVIIVECLFGLSVVLLVGCFGFDIILVFLLISTYVKERLTKFSTNGQSLLRNNYPESLCFGELRSSGLLPSY
jgi:hypothetical protein